MELRDRSHSPIQPSMEPSIFVHTRRNAKEQLKSGVSWATAGAFATALSFELNALQYIKAATAVALVAGFLVNKAVCNYCLVDAKTYVRHKALRAEKKAAVNGTLWFVKIQYYGRGLGGLVAGIGMVTSIHGGYYPLAAFTGALTLTSCLELQRMRGVMEVVKRVQAELTPPVSVSTCRRQIATDRRR